MNQKRARFVRVSAAADRVADPNQRFLRWLGLLSAVIGTILGIAGVAVLASAVVGSSKDNGRPAVVSGEIGHGNEIVDRLQEMLQRDAIVELHLTANPRQALSGIDDEFFDFRLPSVSSLSFAFGICGRQGDPVSCQHFTIQTIGESDDIDLGWEYDSQVGLWRLDGTFVVRNIVCCQSGTDLRNVRKLRPEEARRL